MILTKNADVGEVVAPFGAATNAKAAVVTMADMNSLMVEVDVSEVGIAKIQVGGAAEIRLDAFPDERFPGTVHMIVPTADRAKATVLTKVAFNRRDTRVLPEMSAKVAFLSRPLAEGEDRPFLGAPAASVVQKGQDWRVFVVKNSVVEERKISIGRRWPDFVEALSGLKDGELIALNPEGLSNGTRVVIEQ
jgi:multidrug efflux pump subunit AcrA (membrane-fusion protein)